VFTRLRKFIWTGGTCIAVFSLLVSCGGGTPAHVPLPPLDAEQTSAAPRDLTEYRLQAGDTVRIKYLYHPELNVKIPIRPDGDLSLQVAGLGACLRIDHR